MNNYLNRKKKSLLLLLLGLIFANCHAVEKATDWKTECVGHYQLSAPGEIELALTTIRKLYKPDETIFSHLYNDGISSPYVKFNGIEVTAEVSFSEFETLKRFFASQNQRYKSELLKKAKEERIESLKEQSLLRAKRSKPLRLNEKNMFGWEYLGGMDLYMFHNGHIFFYENSSRRSLPPEVESITPDEKLFEHDVAQRNLDAFLKAFRPRRLYELPDEEGICIPYGFISESNVTPREIGVAMRLKHYPDVEIYLLEETPVVLSSMNANLDAKDELAFFWTRRYGAAKEVRLKWPPYRTVTLDQREGASTFVEILRKDDSVDFGYAAYVKGDPKAETDTPNLMLN